MRRRFAKLFLVVLLSVAAQPPDAAQADASPLSAPLVKAAFLFNFAKFVTWPTESSAPVRSPLVLGFLGRDPVEEASLQTLAGKTVRGRPLEMRRVDGPDEAKKCDILFISRTERSRLGLVLDSLRQSSILTVSDMEGFAERGGVIGLVSAGKKIRFEINLEAARKAKLTVSSQLLALATVLQPVTGLKRP